MENEEKQTQMLEQLETYLKQLPDCLKNNDKNYLEYYVSRMRTIIKDGGSLLKSSDGYLVATIKRKSPYFSFNGMEDIKELEKIILEISNYRIQIQEESNELMGNETYLTNITSSSAIDYKLLNGGGYREYTRKASRTNSIAKDVKVSNNCEVRLQDEILSREFNSEGYITSDIHQEADPLKYDVQRNMFEFQTFSSPLRPSIVTAVMPRSKCYFAISSRETGDNYIVRSIQSKDGVDYILCKAELSKTPYNEGDSYYESYGKKITSKELAAIRSDIQSEYIDPSRLLEEQKSI